MRSFVDGLLKQRKESTEPGSVDINAIRKQMQQLEPSEIKQISEFAQKIQSGRRPDGKSSCSKESMKQTEVCSNHLTDEHLAYLRRLPMNVIE